VRAALTAPEGTQQFTHFCCIRPIHPYLSAHLKPDNLPGLCNNDSEKVLRCATHFHIRLQAPVAHENAGGLSAMAS